MHAEKCPVCNGVGMTGAHNGVTGTRPITCRGCGGKGWVTVAEAMLAERKRRKGVPSGQVP